MPRNPMDEVKACKNIDLLSSDAAIDKTQKPKKQGKAGNDKSYEEWEKRGAADFKDGKPRRPPYWEYLKPGVMIGSPESKEALKKTESWLRGWDRANLASSIETG